MGRDALWLVLVMLLGASLLVLLLPGDEAVSVNEEDTEEEVVEESTCLVGTQKVLNASAPDGYDCVPLDPHAMFHTHPAPVLSVSNVIDDGSAIAILGDVNHLHPDEITVRLSLDEDVVISTQPNTDGAWSLTVQSSAEQVYLNITAAHDVEETTSDTTFIEINRTTSENESHQTDDGTDNETGDGTGNETGDGTGNETGNNPENGTDDSVGNETGNNPGNGTDGPTEPTQPTYDPSDMGQFWLDVFRCQAGQNITQVDDLSTAAVETHECSVSITMNETHITITTNGLPDHDFESTLACTQANDCTRAQNYEWTVPRSPVNDTTGGHDATNCPEANGDYECAAALGEVAIAINGVPFYGPEDGPGGDAVASHHGVYEEDRQPIELGVCHAHNGQGGTFHYHADANCLHWHPDAGEDMLDYNISTPAAVAENTANGSHSAVIGVAMDGYPIYGLWGYDDQMNIVEMKSSYKLKDGETGYNGIDDYIYLQGLGHLDVCNGHFGPTPEFPDGIYHYHSTMTNGEGDMGFPYFLLCYHGETFLDEGNGGADCSGFGETWGPGIGPPPPGCEGGPGGGQGGQLSEVSAIPSAVASPAVMLWMLAFALLFLRQRRD
ncbi:MAG: YHYH protein [Candidatus Thermoplasmatota archaeon]|nr:YHYH protein [Candidatus Thermoplasmatota archaeon]